MICNRIHLVRIIWGAPPSGVNPQMSVNYFLSPSQLKCICNRCFPDSHLSTDVIRCLQMGPLDLVAKEINKLNAYSIQLARFCLFQYLCTNPGPYYLLNININYPQNFSLALIGHSGTPVLLQPWFLQLLVHSCTV